ncbi:mannose-specific lectin-like [Asparagus officinalis]|uniref:mannose-specific lectin-like n=1 Tax=Asparagus officinalis TaxID=4686 RepID=UPI00098E6C5B|nr:mannose-specific lectin-like [Asparagus officinalis]
MAKMTPPPLLILILGLAITTQYCSADDVLLSPEALYSGRSLNYGPYMFTMQNDCNLVLYDSGNPIWASNTGGRGYNCRCVMQRDGNLVVYDQNNNAVWASGTSGGDGNYVLVLQKDRNVVIYGPARWSTGTNYRGSRGVVVVAAQNSTLLLLLLLLLLGK